MTLTTSRPSYIGASGDYEFVINFINKKYPKAPLVGLGTSIGGNLILKYAGESKEKCKFAGIAVVSTPFDLLTTVKFLSRSNPVSYLADVYLLD